MSSIPPFSLTSSSTSHVSSSSSSTEMDHIPSIYHYNLNRNPWVVIQSPKKDMRVREIRDLVARVFNCNIKLVDTDNKEINDESWWNQGLKLHEKSPLSVSIIPEKSLDYPFSSSETINITVTPQNIFFSIMGKIPVLTSSSIPSIPSSRSSTSRSSTSSIDSIPSTSSSRSSIVSNSSSRGSFRSSEIHLEGIPNFSESTT